MSDENKKGLYIQLYSLHGLIRGKELELGRDADTGGQIKYVFELASMLSTFPEVEKVELVTRWIYDKKVSPDYSVPIEKVNDKFDIVRIRAGGGKYIRKELLWNYLEEFSDKSIKYLKAKKRLPDFIHSHYADAGYVCTELTKFFGIPFFHSSHSLGKDKIKKLTEDGVSPEMIEKRYKISQRIESEEKIFYFADMIVTSTSHEIENHLRHYDNVSESKFKVIPPGVNLEKFFPYNEERKWDAQTAALLKHINREYTKFFVTNDKPLILSLCRPDRRKNISGLITAYGEDKELQKKANLAIYAGVRDDIATMEENEREVLTEILLLMDKYNLYGKMAIPKKHDTDFEVPELYRLAAKTGGVFVNAALSETFGLTLIEAAATGVPVVATEDGGPRDIIANCKNGIKVDVSDPKNISKALNKIFDDKELWNAYSENGIKNVKKYYSWQAHAEKYLYEANKILKAQSSAKDLFVSSGKKLLAMEKMIVSDIDYTLLGDDVALSNFKKTLKQMPQNIGFGVATGRVVESAIEAIKKNKISMPDFFITSVGSEIYYKRKDELVYSTGWDAHISHLWNRERIVELLSQFGFLKYQEKQNQRKFKISYYTSDNPKNINKVKQLLVDKKIKCSFIFSHGQFLDILPYRASKGKAIRYLAYRWNIPFEKVLVAGDSGNDMEMLKGELLGVVVANYSPELENLKGSRRIYFSDKNFAAGIIDGINHYNFI
ncbi:MAG: HAD-IIB family hydrolase [Ignavibacteriaceae bacterium]|nr:HAD-IIB family hydrolase [Ignavibacterium sp.]MCC6255833.1 HAD-IIB family hydrolase [Ignavibacteriaceae bacterium]HMN25495.1 HAD-IIB family hydrolase [Ignavibacteriaceae bacterium]HRN25600.1 HAD-IIB family hydrolase [Ignavibacteriaceae bacterium]HRQ53219.1 HAD-IIB family hydrolase [Ignavibacteriaceae bacterium]